MLSDKWKLEFVIRGSQNKQITLFSVLFWGSTYAKYIRSCTNIAFKMQKYNSKRQRIQEWYKGGEGKYGKPAKQLPSLKRFDMY